MTNLSRKKDDVTIGVISDTHGLLRPEVLDIFENVDRIIHAGDIGRESVLYELSHIAPVVAVRGNMDGDSWAFALKRTEVVEINKSLIYVIHDLGRLDINPKTAKCRVVISGHSHRPAVKKHHGVLYLNPGSAGPRRFKLPVSVALLSFAGEKVEAEIVRLKA
jgi:putative phosphoesterase